MADCGPAELASAVSASERYLRGTSQEPRKVRHAALLAWRSALLAHQKLLAELIVSETGKLIDQVCDEIDAAAYHIACIVGDDGALPASHGDSAHCTATRRPLGTAFVMTAPGRPAAAFCQSFAAPFAAGCPVILLPCAEAPVTSLVLAQLWEAVGGKPGSLSVLPTSRPSALLRAAVDQPAIKRLGLPDSAEVATILAEKADLMVQRATFYPADQVPFVIFDDADIKRAAAEAAVFRLKKNAHLPVRVQTIYVHDSVAQRFSLSLAAEVRRLVSCTPQNGTDGGHSSKAGERTRLAAAVTDAEQRGAVVLRRRTRSGWIPTVVHDAPPDALLLLEDYFGPIVPVVAFRDLSHLIQLFAALHAPIGVWVWTGDTVLAQEVAKRGDIPVMAQNGHPPFLPDAFLYRTTDARLEEERFQWTVQDFLAPLSGLPHAHTPTTAFSVGALE